MAHSMGYCRISTFTLSLLSILSIGIPACRLHYFKYFSILFFLMDTLFQTWYHSKIGQSKVASKLPLQNSLLYFHITTNYQQIKNHCKFPNVLITGGKKTSYNCSHWGLWEIWYLIYFRSLFSFNFLYSFFSLIWTKLSCLQVFTSAFIFAGLNLWCFLNESQCPLTEILTQQHKLFCA